MIRLKPCPFCGQDDAVYALSDFLWHVECSACFVSTYGYYTPEEAAQAWNRRKGHDPENREHGQHQNSGR